jgi:hypothetical protein
MFICITHPGQNIELFESSAFPFIGDLNVRELMKQSPCNRKQLNV